MSPRAWHRIITSRSWAVGLVAAGAALAGLGTAASSQAATKAGYCRSYARKHHLIRRFRDGAVSLSSPARDVRSYTVCSDRTKRRFVFEGVGGDQTLRMVRAVDGRCLALVVDHRGGLPELLTLDPRAARDGELDRFGSLGLLDGNTSDRVVSLQLTSTCVVVVGLSGTDSSGAPTRQLVAQYPESGGGFDAIDAGAAMTDAELGAIEAVPSGDGAQLSWTEGGVPKSQVLVP